MSIIAWALLVYVILSYVACGWVFFFSPDLDAEDKARGIETTKEQKFFAFAAAPMIVIAITFTLLFERKKR